MIRQPVLKNNVFFCPGLRKMLAKIENI